MADTVKLPRVVIYDADNKVIFEKTLIRPDMDQAAKYAKLAVVANHGASWAVW